MGICLPWRLAAAGFFCCPLNSAPFCVIAHATGFSKLGFPLCTDFRVLFLVSVLLCSNLGFLTIVQITNLALKLVNNHRNVFQVLTEILVPSSDFCIRILEILIANRIVRSALRRSVNVSISSNRDVTNSQKLNSIHFDSIQSVRSRHC
jgi:hypothetical protein